MSQISARRFVLPFLSASLCLLSLIPAQAGSDRFALVVGVREYPVSPEVLPKLAYAEKDASTLAETLTGKGYNVTLMTHQAAAEKDIPRLSPTATYIKTELGNICNTPYLDQDDCLIVILAGHGIQLPSKEDPKKFTWYFCAADSDIKDLKHAEDVTDKHHLLQIEELYASLKNCKAGVKLLVVDACRNDPADSGPFRSATGTRPIMPEPPKGLAALFSCSPGERAVEDPTLKQGVFSFYLNEALTGNRADYDDDGSLDLSEIEMYVGKKTYSFVRKNYGRRQTPELVGTGEQYAALVPVKPTLATPPEKEKSQASSGGGRSAADSTRRAGRANSLQTNARGREA